MKRLPPIARKILAANKTENIRRRAERAQGGDSGKPLVTCPASRHVMMMADALAARGPRRQVAMFEDGDHCAGSIYAVLEALWKARAELKQWQDWGAP